MRLNRLFVAALLIVASAALWSCVNNQIGDNARDNSIIGPGPLPSPSPSPSASPSPSPSASPSSGQIALRVGPYGDASADGRAGNNTRPYPIAADYTRDIPVTATPKYGDNRDVPLEAHGKAITWSVPDGANVIDVFPMPELPNCAAENICHYGFNVIVRRERPGTATLRATLRPPGGGEVTGEVAWVVS